MSKLNRLMAHRATLTLALNRNLSSLTMRNVLRAIKALDSLISLIGLYGDPLAEKITKQSIRKFKTGALTDRRIYTRFNSYRLKNIYLSLNGVGSMDCITIGVHTLFIHSKGI